MHFYWHTLLCIGLLICLQLDGREFRRHGYSFYREENVVKQGSMSKYKSIESS